jgi:NTE family protein
VAATADVDDAEDAVRIGLDVWRGIGRSKVFAPIAARGPVAAGRYLLGLAGIGSGLDGLLDVRPLRATLEAFPRWPRLHAAIGERLDALAVLATAGSAGRAAVRTDVFVEGGRQVAGGASPPTARRELPPDDEARGVRYVQAVLSPDHVLASAAIPVAFPPVRIEDPARGAGWYLDGGVRLNAPIKPALELGADRLVVVATHALEPGTDETPADAGAAPDVFSAGAAVMTAALVDRMVDDVRSLRRVNRLVEAGSGAGYRHVPCLFVGPSRDGAIADAAAEVLAGRYSSPLGGDYFLLNRIVGGTSRSHPELLSFLLFDRDFIEALIELGRADATAAVAGPDPWSP